MAQTPAGATAGGSVSAASLWDDETHLGRGPSIAAEAWMPLGGWVRLGAETGWFGHHRDSGYLVADGHVLQVMGRAALFAGPRRWAARPFLGVGLGVARSSGTLRLEAPFATPAELRQPWALTHTAWELHAGIRLHAGQRWAVRPEVRVGAIGSAGNTGGLQTPLLRLQAGAAVEWALR